MIRLSPGRKCPGTKPSSVSHNVALFPSSCIRPGSTLRNTTSVSSMTCTKSWSSRDHSGISVWPRYKCGLGSVRDINTTRMDPFILLFFSDPFILLSFSAQLSSFWWMILNRFLHQPITRLIDGWWKTRVSLFFHFLWVLTCLEGEWKTVCCLSEDHPLDRRGRPLPFQNFNEISSVANGFLF